MAYIGKSPQQGNYVVLDAITASSTNTYNLLNGGVAFTPESANHMIVSLNGVIQAPNTAFSVSGSTITFLPSSGTLSSSDSIDFIMVLGNVLDIGTPSDSTVTNAKTNFVSSSSSAGLSIKGDGTSSGTGGQLQLNCSLNSHGIKLESPAHSAGQSYTLKFPTGNVTAGKVLKVDSITGSGTTAVGQLSFDNSLTLSSVQTISSAVAQVDVTVPAGTKVITCAYYGLSSASTENVIFRVGTSGGILTSGYEYSSGYVGSGTTSAYTGTTTFPIGQGFTATNNSLIGIFEIRYVNGQYYSFTGHGHSAPYTGMTYTSGGIDVGSVTDITTIRVFGDTGGNLDAGTFVYYFQ